MAPIFSAAVGVAPQIIDDERLFQLRTSLEELELKVPLIRTYKTPKEVGEPVDIDRLVSLLEPWQSWAFEEQIDLQEWIHPLNKIDACLSYFIQKYPSLLLVGPVERTKSRGAVKAADQLISEPAESIEQVNAVPLEEHKNICIIVRFLAGILLNSSNKCIFNSVEELVDLLAAADDSISSVALEALCNLATVPCLHRQQAPEVQQHSTALHNSRTTSHKRLIALARGWGTRGSGLGLYTCSTVDDSEFGQGALPKEASELNFTYFRSPYTEEEKEDANTSDTIEVDEVNESYLVRICLHAKDILVDNAMAADPTKTTNDNIDKASKQKRRRVGSVSLGEKSIRSTAELFFLCLEKAGGRNKIPPDRLFPLLADIRLARSFHCRATRVAAVERRLRSLITILNSNPSQEIMSGYFQAQPELCVELIDLLRPTVSSAAVSAAGTSYEGSSSFNQDAVAALANSPGVPYGVRKLAVESLTALVARRDGTSGALTGVARHSNVLNELGVGKGQYLGLLPTLIRFSLASFGSFLSTGGRSSEKTVPLPEKSPENAISFEIGLAFVEATTPPQIPREEQLEQALEFIESVLTLAASVVSTPSGTSALTDCGLIPALLTTVAFDTEKLVSGAISVSSSPIQAQRIGSLLRFITAQAVQILEGAIVTHNNALSAFHNLQGVEVLTTRLYREILSSVKKSKSKAKRIESEEMDCDRSSDTDAAGKMEVDSATSDSRLHSSQRVLLFSIVTCLTVVFHQESTSSAVTTPSGSTEMRKPELTNALIEIMENAEAYGGHLASLIATLLSDVMNSDPHVVHYVHKSGVAKSFLKMLMDTHDGVPVLPAVPELIMAIPNVLSALALTEDGAKEVKKANPFPSMLRLFYHYKYSMPKSRCLLNEMTAIVGTGLDEIMRHVNSLRPLICEAIAEAMNKVAEFGEGLSRKEEMKKTTSPRMNIPASDLENERSCLMQYALNFGQILEQILHNEDHCEPFVSAGGLDALIKLYPYMMSTGTEFLSHISCLSCPSVSTLTHSTTEDSLVLAFKCIAVRYDSFKLLQKMINTVTSHLNMLEECQMALREAFPSERNQNFDGLDATCILEGLPREAIYATSDPAFEYRAKKLSNYLRQVVVIQYMTNLLSAVIKASCQQSQETESGWSSADREWKRELSSSAFQELVARLSQFYQSAVFEVCRIRTEHGFEEREMSRMDFTKSKKLRYRLRIVCPEGAVVRDGIEIDSCASVGSMEMGEIVDAFDRCVNSSGVLRYRTHRGWVSEQTRGHGRESIAEVLNVWEPSGDDEVEQDERLSKSRVESGVPDICSTGANVLARVQTSYSDLFSALTRVVIQGVRHLPVRHLTFEEGTIGAHVAAIMKILASQISKGFKRSEIGSTIKSVDSSSQSLMDKPGLAMYLGCLLSHLQSCLFEEKRERRVVNIPLLIVLANIHEAGSSSENDTRECVSFLDAINFIFKQSLDDFRLRVPSVLSGCREEKDLPHQRLSRTTAACLPTATMMLRRLLSISSITSSPISSVLTRVKKSDLPLLLGESDAFKTKQKTDSKDTFSPEKFTIALLCNVSEMVMEIWVDPKFVHSPPYIAHPIANLVSELMSSLEDVTKKVKAPITPPTQNPRDESRLWNSFRGLVASTRGEASQEEEIFQPSEEAISRLMEMGFSRDHAWDALDSTRTNRVEIAMEYALSHPPPSPVAIQARRAANMERVAERQRQERENSATSNEGENVTGLETRREEEDDSSTGNKSEAMDVDAEPVSEMNVNPKAKQDESLEKAKGCLASWKMESTRIVCNMLGNSQSSEEKICKSEGDGEVEALTVVLCSFLLDLCQRYPDDRDRIATELLARLKEQIEEDTNSDNAVKVYRVQAGKELSFAALCHGAVLFTRALPKTRKLILNQDLVHRIVSCIQVFLNSPLKESIMQSAGGVGNARRRGWPVWLSSSLLLLDIMAQPVVAFSWNKEGDRKMESGDGELMLLKEEHKKQRDSLSILAGDIFTALYSPSDKVDMGKPKEGHQNPSKGSGAEKNEGNGGKSEKPEASSIFQSVPAYFPLLPETFLKSCADISLRLISGDQESFAPPGVIHGALLLLMRLLRSPKMSSHCLKEGTAEKVLSLPRKCRFTGHSGLITLILRRLLEDETTLQTAMETEIRGTITKLHRKEGNSSSDKDKPSVPRRAFVQAITPLLCRDPASFLKAVAVSVYFEKDSSENKSDAKVTLLSTTDRTKNMKILTELLKSKHTSSLPKLAQNRRHSGGGRQRRLSHSRSKTPTRSNKKGSTPKRSKKEKSEHKEKNDEDAKASYSQSPVSHVISLLISHIITQSSDISKRKEDSEASSTKDFGFDNSFLWTANMLFVLADLVLAIPACATAIHKFRPPRSKEKHDRQSLLCQLSHALSGCPSPPKTFVSYLLHTLLSQDRWSSQKDHRFWNTGDLDSDVQTNALKVARKAAFRRTKVVQSTARLLIALVARPGEGRRRVIAELTFALSGGQLGLNSSPLSFQENSKVQSHANQLHALHAWGELCIGLAAPRSNGSSYDGSGTLSFEVVKIMLENGMAHALLISMHRVPLHHPMATSTIGSLILPFEILSRPSVGDVVKGIVDKELPEKESKGQSKASKQQSASEQSTGQNRDTSQRNDSFADDHLLEDAFGMDAGGRRRIDHGEAGHDDEDDEDEMEIDDDIESENNSEDDEMSSSDNSEESSDVDSSEDEDEVDSSDDEEEEEEDASSILEDDDVQNSDEFEADFNFDGDYREDAIGAENQDHDGGDDSGTDRGGDRGLDEGWTRIESSGFGGMVLGSRRGVGGQPGFAGGNMNSRARGFIDAAEAMIGTLLRTGEIHGDALAEIEGSLGIRIMPGGPGGIRAAPANRRDLSLGEMFGSRQLESGNNGNNDRRNGEIVGTLPHIHQRSQPDVGYSALGGGGRWNEISSMEYIYGGPSITAGSRNYDIVSPIVTDDDEDHLPTISQLDGRLFPGGPASATHARTQHSLHPLLCGVDLPPVNSLVSDLLPHGVRATRRGQMTTRRPGDWTNASFSSGGFLVSTSNGNIVRSNRPNNASISSLGNAQGGPGPVGWTDDGLPFDATVEHFSSAFEHALGESMTEAMSSATQLAGSESQQESSDASMEHQDSAENEEAENAMGISSLNEDNTENHAVANEEMQETTDGDRVASSLESGLRLSSDSDGSGENSTPTNEQQPPLESDAQMDEALNEESPQNDRIQEGGAATSQSETPGETGGTVEDESEEQQNSVGESNGDDLACPPGMDPEVFAVLPAEMQREVIEQARTEADLAAQLDAGSSLDPEVLAALPEDMRREAIEQEQRERRLQEAPADPANAEEMDNASFVASLAPDLRNEILITADDDFLQSLPPDIIAEAQILRERASSGRRAFELAPLPQRQATTGYNATDNGQRNGQGAANREQADAGAQSARRRQRVGKIRVESERQIVLYLPPGGPIALSTPVSKTDLKALLRFMYLLSPVRPQRLVQKVFQNLCTTPSLRHVLSATFVKLLHDDNKGALVTLDSLEKKYSSANDWRAAIDSQFADALKDFPPRYLIGAAPEVLDTDGLNPNITILRRKQTSDTAASIAANLPMSANGSRHEKYLPPVVATRMVDTLQQICKASPKFCIDLLIHDIVDDNSIEDSNSTGFEKLLDLLEKPRYSKSSANLEQLLTLLESAVSPLSHLSKHGEEDVEISQRDVEAAASTGKEWVDVPRIVVSQERLQLLCSILRMETCRDTAFAKVNTIARRLCRVDANRGYVLAELASVSRALGADSIRDLKALSIRMSNVISKNETQKVAEASSNEKSSSDSRKSLMLTGSASNSVAVSTSTSELKLLRVLQTLQALCVDTSEVASGKKNEGIIVTEELVHLLRAMNLNDLWAELTACLRVVQVLEGVSIEEDADKKADEADGNDGDEENTGNDKKLQNSVAGLLTRFLPSIEAFFVANASSTRSTKKTKDDEKEKNSQSGKVESDGSNSNNLVGGNNLVNFVNANKVLLNALVRNNASLLEKGLKPLIMVPSCRILLDFDVKRQWFKTQVRRLRQQASRRHGSLRLHIRRKNVFEDAYHQLRLRNADEMRGRLHITFRNEDGVDAGGLSREFFGILAKEIFNPNYALFTSTEDGSTFQPNPNSSINPDHLSYFRFVGRIVGKAVSDGYLLDAHFTRSLYKHMLRIKPTHHDMEAIDPDYYKNLKSILEFNLGDLCLDLTFSTEDHSFGRTRLVDLIPNGRKTPVTEQNKGNYVSLVCQHRMTTAISSQIKAYLDGFYELVSPDLVAIFSPRELELLISGLPDIDVHDLKQNTDYHGWKATDRQIGWFWNVLFSLSRNQKASFLQFVTGSSKVPLAGFGELPGMRGVQKFSIHKASGSNGALMSAHTCFNSVDLPTYSSEEELREKMLYSINEGGGTFLLA